MISKLKNNQKGFSLTEVLIAMSVLTVAIVAVTSILVGLIKSNRNNLQSLQAYYLAVEGLEAVHNVRASNWLHNLNWLNADNKGLWGGENFELPAEFGEENNYIVSLDPVAFEGILESEVETLDALSSFSPWKIMSATENNQKIYRFEDSGTLLTHNVQGNALETPFNREITFQRYQWNLENEENIQNSENQEFVLVQSKVTWEDGNQEKEIVLSTVLTNWNEKF